MWKVYKLVNASLSECFVGVTDGDPRDRFHEAANGGIEALDHWDAEEHRITLEAVGAFDARADADACAAEAVAAGGCLRSA